MVESGVELDLGLDVRGPGILFVAALPLEVDVRSQLNARLDEAGAGVERRHKVVYEDMGRTGRHFHDRGFVGVQAGCHELRRCVARVVAEKRPTKNELALLPRTALAVEQVAQPRLALHPFLLERHVVKSGTETERPQGTDKVYPRTAVDTVSPRSLGGGVGVFDLEPLRAPVGKVGDDIGLLSMLIQNDTVCTQSSHGGALRTYDILSLVSYAGNMTHDDGSFYHSGSLINSFLCVSVSIHTKTTVTPAGNRTRVTTLEGSHSTTELQVLFAEKGI